ncbi:MAG: 7-cyano-7-deazaguanine synthase QueC [Leptospiraceae bacterium]|nr:7-cyano-7-deazaguanine synthase QueC [Leptospiraceae bacterium]MCK6381314.1 7-cyano-7-deazaguanine synthase QueC [Leptospiraceae bacterium]NUM40793.1 7-cyano-7-deazaguanine synthase QueC [Leptospiraceae bacterium]
MKENKKDGALVLFSGGLDSTTCLYLALQENKKVYALSFDYSQRHNVELKCAKKIVKSLNTPHIITKIDRNIFKGSSLVEKKILISKDSISKKSIPNTYVPGRNLLFLSFASSVAESNGLNRIYIGVNALDYSGYPDCRPEFIKSFQKTVQLGTKAGVQGKSIKIITPLLKMKKKEIVLLAKKLQVPFSWTHSCYDPKLDKPCGHCESCLLRKKGFEEAGIVDK